jgi:hypothetical protein
MKRQIVSLAAVAVFSVAACTANAGGAPTAAPASTPAATSASAGLVELPIAPGASADPTPIELHVFGTPVAFADGLPSNPMSVRIPDGWITISGGDMPDAASLATWRAAHPEVPPDVATALADELATPGLSLMAFDFESAFSGFTPRVSVTWIDAPVGDLEPWLAQMGTKITTDYSLDSAPGFRAWPTDLGVGVGAFQYLYLYSTQDTALAGTQLIVPMPDGRAAVFTFTCKADQIDELGWIASAIFGSVSKGA